jgi:uncharacterized protein
MTRPDVEVTVTQDSLPFWAGLTRGEIVTAWCDACDRGIWPPLSHCPACLSPSTRTRSLGSRGSVYSFSVVHQGDPAFAGAEPYVLAYVTVDNGPTIMCNVTGVPPADIYIGMRVKLRSPGPATAGTRGAQFEPDEQS